MYTKSRTVLIAVFALFSVISIQLWRIMDTQPAQVVSSQNRWVVNVANTRGTIYDCNGVPLVNEEKEWRAAVAPDETLLRKIYDCTTLKHFQILRDQLTTGKPASVILSTALSPEDGLCLFYTPKRYSSTLLAAHVIGYLDDTGHGVCGIEKGYDAQLEQYAGKATAAFFVDASGRYLAGIKPAVSDDTARSVGGVVLTINRSTQQAVETIGNEYLPKGAIIVTKANSGDILASASFPNFQPQTVADSIQADDGALTNRALSLYDCGSVFKIITTAAALEHGVSIEKAYVCDGSMDVEGITFHCHNRDGHGKISMTQAFSQSCNLYYIQLAQDLGAGEVFSMARQCGLQNALTPAAEITAGASILPNINTLSSSAAALANFSFGQGYLLTTPLHIAQLTTAITNNGIMYPLTLITGEIDEKGTLTACERGGGVRIFSQKTAKSLQKLMRSVVETGTGTAAAPTNSTAAGKTGTAETGQVNADGSNVVQSWFTGYFPAENPQYTITVLAENAQFTNTKSTEIFKRVCEEIGSLINN